MAIINKLNVLGDVYEIRDADAQEKLGELGSIMSFRGKTTTALSDGSTTNPITIDGESYTAIQGDLVVYSVKEFIWDGSKWVEVGNKSNLGELAYKDSVAVTYSKASATTGSFQITPAGTVTLTSPASAGTGDLTVSVSGTTASAAAGTVSGTISSVSAGTPSGAITVSQGSNVAGDYGVTVSGNTQGASTSTFTPSGSFASGTANISIGVGTGTANYTPAGQITTQVVTGATASYLKFSAGTSDKVDAVTGYANTSSSQFVTAVSVLDLTVSLAGSSSSASGVKYVDTVSTGSLIGTYDSSTLTLTLSYTAPSYTYSYMSATAETPSFTPSKSGALVSLGAPSTESVLKSVSTSISSATSTGAVALIGTATKGSPSFTGTAVNLKATDSGHTHAFNGQAGSIAHTHTFSGTDYIHATFSGSALGSHSHTFSGDALPEHSHGFSGSDIVSAAFAGTPAYHSHDLGSASANADVTYS